MAADSILTTVRQYLEFDPTDKVTLEPIKRGASGRTIVRVKTEEYEPFIGIHWTDERADNDFYPPVSHFLEKAGIHVPSIMYENLKWRVALVEDLGDEDLLALKGTPWETREPYYRSAFEQLDKLFYCRAGKTVEFNPPFDTAMYRWEQEYFFEHLMEELLRMHARELREAPEFEALAERLGGVSKHLVHRDFQSQNFLLRDEQAYWIDFQGMRRGRQEYDLASLIHDPYLDHSEEERERLMDLWEDVAEDRPAESMFRDCAIQRLMQAMGAFGNIIVNRGDDWYRQHVSAGARQLAAVVKGTEFEELLAPVLEKAAAFPA
ncbi:phosphotransferase [Haloferula helveola]|uniref:Phosphotransferase n=1 Tax=Haloferula helveola TaxID=490095 RepID=A0ABM7RAG5_9BACT|nr:phosphotransferase [Haloferula helveola]